jgi:hypothetical protein
MSRSAHRRSDDPDGLYVQKVIDSLPLKELFTDQKGDPFVSIEQRTGVVETYLFGEAFSKRLQHIHHKKHRQIVRPSVLEAVLANLVGLAMFEGKQRAVHLRLAAGTEGEVFWDLGDPDWRVIRIGPDGWDVQGSNGVKFRRPPGYQRLPEPVQGGTIDALRPFLNVKSDDQFKLLVGYLIASLNPRGPYPILELTGAHGTAKSTTARILRSLVDPNMSVARAMIYKEHDLAIAAENGWMLVFDNLSRLTPASSDALCRLSTGGAFSTRKL